MKMSCAEKVVTAVGNILCRAHEHPIGVEFLSQVIAQCPADKMNRQSGKDLIQHRGVRTLTICAQ